MSDNRATAILVTGASVNVRQVLQAGPNDHAMTMQARGLMLSL